MSDLWTLLFFVLFYIYFNRRIELLKKELLMHYSIFEDILQKSLKERYQSPQASSTPTPTVTPTSSLTVSPTFMSLVPTVEETKNGLQQLQTTTLEWYSSLLGFSDSLSFQDNLAYINF
jgi:hypothetical protein